MQTKTPTSHAENGRRQARTHLFVAATLATARGNVAVRVRNLSSSGALIEFTGLGPTKGERIVLRRGSLEAEGNAAWSDEKKAGLAFDAKVDVSEWMGRTGGNQQSKIDEAVAKYRSDPAGPAVIDILAITPDPLAVQLRAVRNQLERLADRLSQDVDVVMKHPEVQVLDIALQTLDRIIADTKR